MKNVLLVLSIVLLAPLAAMAQVADTTPATPTVVSVSTEKTLAPIEREKFDPAKDPAKDLEKAIAQASAEGKRIILDVGGEWCVWCRYMDRFFILNPELNALKEKNFVWVKVNMDEKNQNKSFLSTYPAISGYPHFFILDEKGKLLRSQGTGILESDKIYDVKKFTDFFKTWAPPEKKREVK